MNTKQILHNALSSQLEAKKAEYEKYVDEVYTPAFEVLSESIKEWFTNKINAKFEKFEFTGDGITINSTNDSWRGDINIKMRGWSPDNRYIELDWSGDSISKNNLMPIDRAILIGEVATNFHLIDNRFNTDWYPKYLAIAKDKDECYENYNELKSALNNLKNEIKQDAVESMKQIGFELKSFKPYFSIDFEFDDDNKRKYYLKERRKDISLQIGRSQYDITYIRGFKVIGKKGNKYKVEIYKDDNTRTYDVLEKKFDTFIDNVINWETCEADRHKDQANERLNREND